MSCSHPGCPCDDAHVHHAGQVFCSQKCADAGPEATPGGCACGHPGCREAAR